MSLAKLGWVALLACVAFVGYRTFTAPHEWTAAAYQCAQQHREATARQDCIDRTLAAALPPSPPEAR